MIGKQARTILLTLLILLLLNLSASVAAPKQKTEPAKTNPAGLPEVIWRDPGNIASLNLIYGAGGKDHAPDPKGTYKFVSEDMDGTSPKFSVEDAQGIRWKVKLGQEPQSETAATRILWAAGYFVDEDYYLAELKVTGLKKLRRGGEFVSSDGTVRRARLERHLKEVKKLGSWDWFENPFLNSREMNGLRVLMALLCNWDLNAYNNSVYEVRGERRYVVSDVGATFGRTGNYFHRSKSVLKDYERAKFIDKTTPDSVDFVLSSRPFAALAVRAGYYRTRTRMEDVAKQIPRADAKWLGQILAQLSAEQIRDCFRAAGYTPEEIEGYAKAVQRRIAELNAL